MQGTQAIVRTPKAVKRSTYDESFALKQVRGNLKRATKDARADERNRKYAQE